MKSAAELRQFQSAMKSHPTLAEQRMWFLVRSVFQPKVEVKRQLILGFYILDFVIVPKLLAIEVDGSSHTDKTDYDLRRTEFIRSCGLDVVRFTNDQILSTPTEVLNQITAYPNCPDAERSFRSALSIANVEKSKYLIQKTKQASVRRF